MIVRYVVKIRSFDISTFLGFSLGSSLTRAAAPAMSKRRRDADDDAPLRQELCCPITHELMRDPVTAADGHSYERAAISYWFWEGKATSPVTNLALSSQLLLPNHSLRAVVRYYKEKYPDEKSDTSWEVRMLKALARRLGSGVAYGLLFVGTTGAEVMEVIVSRAGVVDAKLAADALVALLSQTSAIPSTEAAMRLLLNTLPSDVGTAMKTLTTISVRPTFFAPHLSEVAMAILDAVVLNEAVRLVANRALVALLRSGPPGGLRREDVSVIVSYSFTEPAPDVATAMLPYCDMGLKRSVALSFRGRVLDDHQCALTFLEAAALLPLETRRELVDWRVADYLLKSSTTDMGARMAALFKIGIPGVGGAGGAALGSGGLEESDDSGGDLVESGDDDDSISSSSSEEF